MSKLNELEAASDAADARVAATRASADIDYDVYFADVIVAVHARAAYDAHQKELKAKWIAACKAADDAYGC